MFPASYSALSLNFTGGQGLVSVLLAPWVTVTWTLPSHNHSAPAPWNPQAKVITPARDHLRAPTTVKKLWRLGELHHSDPLPHICNFGSMLESGVRS
ncbi:hypothetical protein C8Q74DRAFT_1252011 [Fomes fomentarius]|nr:hypothetical protein C8Q74DRAFT_1252011 [Fomes fomentarius]